MDKYYIRMHSRRLMWFKYRKIPPETNASHFCVTLLISVIQSVYASDCYFAILRWPIFSHLPQAKIVPFWDDSCMSIFRHLDINQYRQ